MQQASRRKTPRQCTLLAEWEAAQNSGKEVKSVTRMAVLLDEVFFRNGPGYG
jgi:hypothetical protein